MRHRFYGYLHCHASCDSIIIIIKIEGKTTELSRRGFMGSPVKYWIGGVGATVGGKGRKKLTLGGLSCHNVNAVECEIFFMMTAYTSNYCNERWTGRLRGNIEQLRHEIRRLRVKQVDDASSYLPRTALGVLNLNYSQTHMMSPRGE